MDVQSINRPVKVFGIALSCTLMSSSVCADLVHIIGVNMKTWSQ